MTTDAILKFTQKTGALVPSASAQSGQKGVLTLPDGLKVKVEIQVNGVWKEIDSTTFSPDDLSNLVERCQKIYEATTHATGQPKSLTVYFQQKYIPESLKSSILGKVSNRFKDEVTRLDFKKIEYKDPISGKTEVFDLETDELDEADAIKVQIHAKGIAPLAQSVFANSQALTSPKKRKRSDVSEKKSPTNPIAECIQEAGSAGNRCAALSLAKKELAKLKPQAIVDKYKLTTPDLAQSITDAPTLEAKIKLLSDALIEKAATAITENAEFLNPHIELQTQPCLAAIERALNEYKQSNADFNIPVLPEEKVAAYAALMRQPGFMLDLPFFLALGQPFIIIQNDRNYNVIVTSDNFVIPDEIENYDINDINILFYNGINHYQPLILGNDSQITAVQNLIKQYINGLIDNFIEGIKEPEIPSNLKKKRNADNYMQVLRIHPMAKRKIIERLKADYPDRTENMDRLNRSQNDSFADDARAAIHGPIIEEVD